MIKRTSRTAIALATSLLLTSALTAPIPAHATEQIAPDTLAQRLDAAINTGNTEGLAQLLAPDFRVHGKTADLFPKPITRPLYLEEQAALPGILAGLNRTSQVISSGDHSLSLLVTLSGVQAGPYLGLPPGGNHLSIRMLEVWKRKDGQMTDLWRQADDVSALRQMTVWQPAPDMPATPAPAREVAHFPPGTFLESVVADDGGTLYFTTLMTGRIDRLVPGGQPEPFATLPVGGKPGVPEGVMCLTPGEDGALFVNVIAPGTPHHGVWHLRAGQDPAVYAALPDAVIPNGLARDDSGALYVADANAGGIWRVDPQTHAASPWHAGDLLQRRPYIGQYPPTNGLQFWQGSLYATNSDKALVVRIPVQEGGSAGAAEIHARNVGGDDLAIDENGILYVTTHPYNSVIRVDRTGAPTVIATPEQGVVGPTAAVITGHGRDRKKLYVVTDGGLYNPLPGQPMRPNIVELDIGK